MGLRVVLGQLLLQPHVWRFGLAHGEPDADRSVDGSGVAELWVDAHDQCLGQCVGLVGQHAVWVDVALGLGHVAGACVSGGAGADWCVGGAAVGGVDQDFVDAAVVDGASG